MELSNHTLKYGGVQWEFYQLESVDVALAELGKDYNIMSKLDA